MSQGPELLIVGGATQASLVARLPLLAARARAADTCGKSLRDFVRESGRDWTDAPCRLAVLAHSLAQLDERLLLAERLLADAIPPQGTATWEEQGIFFGCPGLAPGEPPASPPPPLPDTVQETVLAVAAEKTGYAVDELGLHLDLQADLGLDSLKHAEVIESLWARFGVPCDETVFVVDFPTLAHMVEHLGRVAPQGAVPAVPAARPGRASLCTSPPARAAAAPAREAQPARPWITTRLADGVHLALATVTRMWRAGDSALRDEGQGLDPLPEADAVRAMAIRLAAREMVARATEEDTTAVRLFPAAPAGPGTWFTATTARLPLTARLVQVSEAGEAVHARLQGSPWTDARMVTDFWRDQLGGRETAVAHVTEALIRKFVREVRVEDAAALATLRGKPLIFVSNHQTAVEMYTFPLIAAALGGRIIEGVAMRDHGVDWADPMRDFLTSHGDIPRDKVAPARAIDTSDPREVLRVIPELEHDLRAGNRSLLIAAEGGREKTARYRLHHMSSVWVDLALAVDAAIVPVRFRGGVPLEDPGSAQDLPLGLGTQDILVGPPLRAEDLRAVPVQERRAFVLAALNRLGPPETEEPHPPDPAFAQDVATWAGYTGAPAILAVLFRALERARPLPGLEMREGRHAMECATDAFVAAGRLGFALRRPVTLALPSTADGQWVAALASMTFGSAGPCICAEDAIPPHATTVVTVARREAPLGD